MAQAFPFLDQVEEQRKRDIRNALAAGYARNAFRRAGPGESGFGAMLNQLASAWASKMMRDKVDADYDTKKSSQRKALAEAIRAGRDAKGAALDIPDEMAATSKPATLNAPVTKEDRIIAALGPMLESGENIEMAPSVAAIVGALHRSPVEHKLKRGEVLYRDGKEYLRGMEPERDTFPREVNGRVVLFDKRTGEPIRDLGSASDPNEATKLTPAQERENAEIDNARRIARRIAASGDFKDVDDPYSAMVDKAWGTNPFTRAIEEKDPMLAKQLRLAGTRKTGKDNEFEEFSDRLSGIPLDVRYDVGGAAGGVVDEGAALPRQPYPMREGEAGPAEVDAFASQNPPPQLQSSPPVPPPPGSAAAASPADRVAAAMGPPAPAGDRSTPSQRMRDTARGATPPGTSPTVQGIVEALGRASRSTPNAPGEASIPPGLQAPMGGMTPPEPAGILPGDQPAVPAPQVPFMPTPPAAPAAPMPQGAAPPRAPAPPDVPEAPAMREAPPAVETLTSLPAIQAYIRGVQEGRYPPPDDATRARIRQALVALGAGG